MKIVVLLLIVFTLSTQSTPALSSETSVLPEAVQFSERRGWKPFWATVFMGNRVGLEYNEGRDFRRSEIIRGIPFLGFIVMLPKFCKEALSLNRMQHIANETGIDDPKRRKYQDTIEALLEAGDTEQATLLTENSPLDENNYPKRRRTLRNRLKSGMVELFLGHREALEWNEGRRTRKVEWASILYLPRIFPAIEAYKGKRMSDIALAENLDNNFGKSIEL